MSHSYPEFMRYATLATLLVSFAAFVQTLDWVTRSNLTTRILIDIDAKYSPENAAEAGVQGLDDQITVLSADRHQKVRADLVTARDMLQINLKAEKDPLVRQDLEILVQSADRDIRNNDAV